MLQYFVKYYILIFPAYEKLRRIRKMPSSADKAFAAIEGCNYMPTATHYVRSFCVFTIFVRLNASFKRLGFALFSSSMSRIWSCHLLFISFMFIWLSTIKFKNYPFLQSFPSDLFEEVISVGNDEETSQRNFSNINWSPWKGSSSHTLFLEKIYRWSRNFGISRNKLVFNKREILHDF